MGFLLDTNIVSELRKRKPHGAVLNWIRKAPEQSLHQDALIAATALEHELTVATRNVADFKPFGVKVVNPFGVG
jgi:predicted nucleic acid-binding protein